MTPPQVDSILIPETDDEIESILLNATKQCYDIVRDHQTLLAILEHPDDKGSRFVKLRRSYPVRREFFNTKIKVATGLAEVASILNTWGFKISEL